MLPFEIRSISSRWNTWYQSVKTFSILSGHSYFTKANLNKIVRLRQVLIVFLLLVVTRQNIQWTMRSIHSNTFHFEEKHQLTLVWHCQKSSSPRSSREYFYLIILFDWCLHFSFISNRSYLFDVTYRRIDYPNLIRSTQLFFSEITNLSEREMFLPSFIFTLIWQWPSVKLWQDLEYHHSR